MDEYKYIQNLFKKYEHKHHPIQKDYILFTNGEILREFIGEIPKTQVQNKNKYHQINENLSIPIFYRLLKQTTTIRQRKISVSIYNTVAFNGLSKAIHIIMAETFLNHNHKKTGLVVDHINNYSLDNRLQNLQIITSCLNKRKDSPNHKNDYKKNRLEFTRKYSKATLETKKYFHRVKSKLNARRTREKTQLKLEL